MSMLDVGPYWHYRFSSSLGKARSTIYCLQIQKWSRMSHIGIGTQYYSRRRRQFYQWDNTSYTHINNDDMGGFHMFNADNPVFNITNIKQDGILSVNCLNQAISRIFILTNVNIKYGTFEANY